MRTILIPSDFTSVSIQVAELLVRDAQEDVKIVFTHLFHVADDIQDLLFSGYREKEYELVPERFWADCKVLKDTYHASLASIKIDFFYGNKLASLKNFLDYHDVTCIAYSESYGIPKLSKSSLDALPVLKKCGRPLVDADLISVNALVESSAVH